MNEQNLVDNPAPLGWTLIRKKTKRGKPYKNQKSFADTVRQGKKAYKRRYGRMPKVAVLREEMLEWCGVEKGLGKRMKIVTKTKNLRLGDILFCREESDLSMPEELQNYKIDSTWKDKEE